MELSDSCLEILETKEEEIPVLKKWLNLGCGTDIRPEFSNIDIQSLPRVDIVADVRDLDIYEDETIDFIVAQHLLGYIPRKDLIPMLGEWKRILKPNGVLEIRVLDISRLTKALYLKDISQEMGMCHEMVLSLLYGKQLNEFDVRHNGFTSDYLQGILRGVGFNVINVVDEELDIIVTSQKPQ